MGVERDVIGTNGTLPDIRNNNFSNSQGKKWLGNTITAATTEKAQQWDGWGTALKPAMELWTLVRKPLIGTVVDNVLEHGTGGLNIDGCRVETNGRPLRETHELREDVAYNGNSLMGRKDGSLKSSNAAGGTNLGRWPANFIHDGGEEIVSLYNGA